MKEILDKLEAMFDRVPLLKEGTHYLTPINNQLTYGELYQLYEFVNSWYELCDDDLGTLATPEEAIKAMEDMSGVTDAMKGIVFIDEEVKFKCTVTGDCGKEHKSLKEWQDCKVCDAILASRLPPKL